MIIKKLSRDFSTSAQISVAEVHELAARGFTTIVCNRPDSEVSAGEASQDIQQAAAAAGLSFHHLPLVPSEVNLEHVEALRKILNDDSCQVLGYCRTGARAASLWARIQTN
jgi:sulfide:quinone oxidoreductase